MSGAVRIPRAGAAPSRLLVVMALGGALVCGLMGCESEDGRPGDGSPSDAGPSADSDLRSDAQAGLDSGVNPGTDSGPAGDTIVGRLVDEAGEPLGRHIVLACMATICLQTESASDGRFVFEGYDFEPPVDIAMKTTPALWATPRRAAALYPYRMEDDDIGLDMGLMRVPMLPAGVLLDRDAVEETVAVGDGLELTVRLGEMLPPFGYPLDEIAARRVPVEWMPPVAALSAEDGGEQGAGRQGAGEPGAEELVAVYALHPFGATSDVPVAVRLPSDLPAGTRVWFRTVSELDGRCSDAVPGRADGMAVATDAGEGIAALTWLLVSR